MVMGSLRLYMDMMVGRVTFFLVAAVEPIGECEEWRTGIHC